MTHLYPAAKLALMSRYHALLGRRVELEYRAGDIVLPATGILAADSGRSIFLEEKVVQRGRVKSFRWEIPYPFLMSIHESALQDPEPAGDPEPQPVADASDDRSAEREESGGHASFLPLRHRSHEA